MTVYNGVPGVPDTWCYYNYLPPGSNVGHYCLIRRSNKQRGIEEIKSNFCKMWNRCNERNVKQVQVYSEKIQEPYDNNTYIFDIETYKDEDNFAIPYSVGLARLCKFRTYLGDLISSEENIPKEKYDILK